jgi:hypothetical protein
MVPFLILVYAGLRTFLSLFFILTQSKEKEKCANAPGIYTLFVTVYMFTAMGKNA